MSSEQMEKLRASNPSISHYAWLVDSGATCHALSDQALSLYEVVREHSGPLPTLLSASDTAMECLKVVDIRVKFGKLNPVILQDVLVCKIGFNVVSPWQASMNGWDTFLTQGSDSCLSKVTSKGTIWVPLVREARSWWVFAKTRVAAKAKAKAKSGAKVRFDPDAMEVDKLKREQELEKKAPDRRESAMVSRHTMHRKVHEPLTGVSRALEVTPFLFALKPDLLFRASLARTSGATRNSVQSKCFPRMNMTEWLERFQMQASHTTCPNMLTTVAHSLMHTHVRKACG